MQKDLLTELHLPKLNLKNVQNIVTQNSARLACLIKENKEYIKKSNKISPGFSVIVGANASDRPNSNFPSPTPGENTKGGNPTQILKKSLRPGEYCFSNGLRKSLQTTIKNNLAVTTNSGKEFQNIDKGKIKYIEIRPSVIAKCIPSPKTTINEASVNDSTTPKAIPSACIETKCLRDIIACKPNDEGPELEVLLYKTYKKRTDPNSRANTQRSLLKQRTTGSPAEQIVAPPNSNGVLQVETDAEKPSEPAFCVISEVVGNASAAFSNAEENSQENEDETAESQLITPKKTNDITKIKGWRRKQFFVEKPTTVEFYSVRKETQRKKIGAREENENSQSEPENVENAFVCDSLDEFLDREADLKIGYEIPHLFAELGIKLTSNEILSRPNLSKKDLEEVETRYCIPVSLPNDITNLDDIPEEDIKRYKRPIEDDPKPSKISKVDDYKGPSGRILHTQSESSENDCEIISVKCKTTTENLDESNIKLSDMKLLSKLIALVVYPGPYMPLHPLVQYHLNKLRSNRTKVDKKWANFAASAVLVNDRQYKRKIVPAYCCVKVDKNSPEARKENDKVNRIAVEEEEEEVKIKPCSVVIKKLDCPQVFNTWCMEHNCHNCTLCGLTNGTSNGPTETNPGFAQRSVERTKTRIEGGRETLNVSPRTSFNKKIARLLSKKVRLLKANGDTLTSIDCLKDLKRDTIEFIKLKFVKESFLAGYINIWYLKPETTSARSRAFLTFSQTSPAPNAINLRSSAVSSNHLPKVITEMVSTENIFDSNEYAILHCNGEIWEIHGSLNITFGNANQNVEQIFTSLELPELTKLQEIAYDILHVKAVKWWVLDLTQKFKLIELKSGNVSTVVTRKKFFEMITLNSYGFVPLRKDVENRVVGAYVIQRLLPFVLIGPYYLLETRDMILKGGSSTVPFRYYGEENVTSNYPLKFFINSVIKNLEKNHKKLEGVWLYDKMCLDKTSYIEVVTSSLDDPRLNSFSCIDIEHGYSLNSLTYSSPSGAASGIVRSLAGDFCTAVCGKKKDGKNELQTVPVYLYFDVFELGYVRGELQFDNSVIIRHPLDGRTKMKSHKIGDWFVSIIRRKIAFIPKDLEVKWFITKHKGDLRGRLPFSKFVLGGAHVLTKNGMLYLLEMTESKIEKLGLTSSDVVRALTECEVLKEVKEVKNLAGFFLNNSNRSLTMDEVLTKAVHKIKILKKLEEMLENQKTTGEKQKLESVSHFLKLLNSLRIRHSLKIQMIESIRHVFMKKNGDLSEEFVKKLKKYRIGWTYLKRFEKTRGKRLKKRKPDGFIKINPESRKRVKQDVETVKKSSNSVCPSNVNETTASNFLNSPSVSGQLNPRQTPKLEIMEISSPAGESRDENPEVTENNSKTTDGFLQLTSNELPRNIKIRWKNLMEKVEVA